jgi:hypothetical protein
LLGRKTKGLSQKFEDFETHSILYIDKDSWNFMRHPILLSKYMGSLMEFYKSLSKSCFQNPQIFATNPQSFSRAIYFIRLANTIMAQIRVVVYYIGARSFDLEFMVDFAE